MIIAGYSPPALRRWLLSALLLGLLMLSGRAAQARQLSHQPAGRGGAARPSGQGQQPTQLAADELLAAEALGYAAGTTATRPRPAQLRAGSWWSWLTALLALALLWVGLALRAARRFNRALATQLRELLGQSRSSLPPPAPRLEPDLASAAPAPATSAPAALPAVASALAQPAPSALLPPPAAHLPEDASTAPPPHQQQALHELQQAARAALADMDFGPAQLAELLALGERTLYRYIKELTGLTPAAYLRELRLQHAHHLLETQACPSVAEVAYQSGFNDPSYFGQVFQKRFGKKPSAYL